MFQTAVQDGAVIARVTPKVHATWSGLPCVAEFPDSGLTCTDADLATFLWTNATSAGDVKRS